MPEANLEIPTTFNAEAREGDLLDYNLKVVPYSMQFQPPGERLRTLQEIWTTMIVPMLPMLQEQGTTIDLEKLLRIVGKYSRLDELNEIIRFQQPSQREQRGPTGGGGERPRQAPVTRRENVRINKSSRTQRGTDAAFAQLLMGGGVQNSEAANALGTGQ